MRKRLHALFGLPSGKLLGCLALSGIIIILIITNFIWFDSANNIEDQNNFINNTLPRKLGAELSQALTYQQIQDYSSAIKLYEKILLALTPAGLKSLKNQMTDDSQAEALWQGLIPINSLDSLDSKNSDLNPFPPVELLIPVIRYNLAHAHYQKYLISQTSQYFTDNNKKKLAVKPVIDNSFYLAQTIYHYLRIIHTPTYSISFSPHLVSLSSNNLMAIRQRHHLSVFTPELTAIDNITQNLTEFTSNFLFLPHIVGISFLLLISLGLALFYLNTSYPHHPEKTSGAKTTILIDLTKRWKTTSKKLFSRLKGISKYFTRDPNQLGEQLDDFYIKTSINSSLSTVMVSKNLALKPKNNYYNNGNNFSKVTPYIKLFKRIIKIGFIIILVVYINFITIFFFTSPLFTADTIKWVNGLTSFFSGSENQVDPNLNNNIYNSSVISTDTKFSTIAVIKSPVSLKQSPTGNARPLIMLSVGETIGIEKLNQNTLANLGDPSNWLAAKTATGITGWISRDELMIIE